MNQPTNSKFVPALPSDDDFNSPTNENTAQTQNSIKIYDGVAECAVNESDTFKNVKIKAKNLAQDNVHKKIADYVYGFWKDRYLTLPDDEVLSIANEICKITDVKYNVIDSDDKILIRATVTAQIDDNDVMNYIIQFFKERTELKSQNEALRKENEPLRNENKALRVENDNLKRQIDELKRQIIGKDKIALSKQKLIEGWKLHGKKDYTRAIKLYNEALELNPYNADAYHNRGVAFRALGYVANANEDFEKAKELGW